MTQCLPLPLLGSPTASIGNAKCAMATLKVHAWQCQGQVPAGRNAKCACLHVRHRRPVSSFETACLLLSILNVNRSGDDPRCSTCCETRLPGLRRYSSGECLSVVRQESAHPDRYQACRRSQPLSTGLPAVSSLLPSPPRHPLTDSAFRFFKHRACSLLLSSKHSS